MASFWIEMHSDETNQTEIDLHGVKTDEGARRKGIAAAKNHPDAKVYVRFSKDDGTRGYINRYSGASFTGKPY